MKYVILTSGKLILGNGKVEIGIDIDADRVQFLNDKVIIAKENKNIELTLYENNLENRISTTINSHKIFNMYRKKGKIYLATENGCYEIDKDLRINRIFNLPTKGCGPRYILAYSIEGDEVTYVLYDWNGKEIDLVSARRETLYLGESRNFAYILINGNVIKVCSSSGCYEKYYLQQKFNYGIVRSRRILLSNGFKIMEFILSSRKFTKVRELEDLIISFDFIFSK